MTPAQLKILHIARRQVGLDEASYRLYLRNVGKVESSKDLTHKAFERMMALMEDLGFVDSRNGPGYWSGKAGAIVNGGITDRQKRLIEQLAADANYHLPGFVQRMTGQEDVNACSFYQAANLIEAFKQILKRGEKHEDMKHEDRLFPGDPPPSPPRSPRLRGESSSFHDQFSPAMEGSFDDLPF